jgi:hypothetical protein
MLVEYLMVSSDIYWPLFSHPAINLLTLAPKFLLSGACFAVYLSAAVRRSIPPPEGCLTRVGLSLADTLADLKADSGGSAACAREICLRETESCESSIQGECLVDVIYGAVLPPGQYVLPEDTVAVSITRPLTQVHRARRGSNLFPLLPLLTPL